PRPPRLRPRIGARGPVRHGRRAARERPGPRSVSRSVSRPGPLDVTPRNGNHARVMAKDVRALHHADRRRDVMMPYAPALLVRRGSLVFLSGVTAAPVYHSHPHREEEFALPHTMREQAVLAMENLKKTLSAAGCTLGDLVSATRYLTDVAEQDDLNRVWADYLAGHLPTTTTVEVSRLATHRNCKIEISAIA